MTDTETFTRWVTRAALFVAFASTTVVANWAVERYGLVSVGFGLMAPAGVYVIGVAFGLRDALHEIAGAAWVLAAIAVGTAVSYLVSDAITLPGGHVVLAVASGAAFLLSELLDFAIYTPLRDRQWTLAVLLSGAVGALVDSALFLWLAFGSLDNLNGQLVGKAYMIALAVPIVGWLRNRRSAVLHARLDPAHT